MRGAVDRVGAFAVVACAVVASLGSSLLGTAHAQELESPPGDLAAVYDAWVDTFQGLPAPLIGDSFEARIDSCGGGACLTGSDTLCIGSSWTPRPGLLVGELVVLVGGARDLSAAGHRVRAVAAPESAGPCGSDRSAVELDPPLDPVEAAGAVGGRLSSLWSNSLHLSAAGYRLIGRRLGQAPASRDRRANPPLLAIGFGSHASAPEPWPSREGVQWIAASALREEGAPNCYEGNGAAGCLTVEFDAARRQLVSELTIPPGPRALTRLSGYLLWNGRSPLAIDLVSRVMGRWLRKSPTVTIPAVTSAGNIAPAWFSTAVLLPERKHPTRLRIRRRADDGGQLLLDALTVRPLSSDAALGDQPLVPDPGSAPIVVTGDSWTTSGELARGLATALSERLGRDLSAQLVSTGKGGWTADGVLRDFDTMIGQHAPAIAVISVGINEAYGGRTAEQFAADIAALSERCAAAGVVPIFIGLPPVSGNAEHAGVHDAAFSLRAAQRHAVLE